MGQYTTYIWAAYALAALVLCINVVLPWRRSKTVRRQLEEYYRLNREPR